MDRVTLVGTAEIRIRLGGISSQRVNAIVTKATFPAPYQTLIMGRVWVRDEVEAWIAEHRQDLAED